MVKKRYALEDIPYRPQQFQRKHPGSIIELANIWCEVLGKIWAPDITPDAIITRLTESVNAHELPITFVALDGDVPVGMCSLRKKDIGIRPDVIYSTLSAEDLAKVVWLNALVVDTKYQKQGIAKMLIDVTVKCAKDLSFEKLYLLAVDPTIPNYYIRLGWKKIGMDEFKSHPATIMERVL